MSETKLRQALREIADGPPGPDPEIPRRVMVGVRRRIAVRVGAAVVGSVLIVLGAITGTRGILESSGPQPAEQPPAPGSAIEGLYMGGPAEVTITGAEEYQGTIQPAEWQPQERIIPGWVIHWPDGSNVLETRRVVPGPLPLRYDAPGIELTIHPDAEWGPDVSVEVVLFPPGTDPGKRGRRYSMTSSGSDCTMSVERPVSDRLEGTVNCARLPGSAPENDIEVQIRFAGRFIESVGSGFTYTTGETEVVFTDHPDPSLIEPSGREGPGTLHWARVDPPGGVMALYYSDGVGGGIWIHGRSFEGTATTGEDLAVAYEGGVPYGGVGHDVSRCTITLHEVSPEALEGSMDCSGRAERFSDGPDEEPVEFTVTFTAAP